MSAFAHIPNTQFCRPNQGERSTIISMDFDTYDSMTVEQLATIREYGLERLQRVTEALKEQVRSDYADGVSVKRLARVANVSRATIATWVKP